MTSTGQTTGQLKHESPELGAAAARMMRALVARAADGDTEALEQLAALEVLIGEATQVAGHQLNRWGYSHSELAAVLGISRQASVKRFGHVQLDPNPLELDGGWAYGWAHHWADKRVSSGQVMRALVARLVSRRAR